MNVILLLLLAGLCIGWNIPKVLVKTPLENAPEDLYTDKKTGISHFLFFRPTRSSQVNYLRFYSNDTVASQTIFTVPNTITVIDARIIGEDDGRSLMVMLNAKRSGSNTYDIFYADSSDGGKTWTDFQAVPRPNMNDNNDRYSNCILHIKEGDRYYIFYHLYANNEIGFVTRSSGSRVFTNEKVIYNDKKFGQSIPSLTATYTKRDYKIYINLFWINVGEGSRYVYHMSTNNNGVTWTEAARISYEITDDKNILTAESNPKISNKLVVTYKKIFEFSALRMVYSTDNGATWSNPTDFTIANQKIALWEYKINSMIACGTTYKPRLASITKTGDDKLEYALWDLNTMKPNREDHPFGQYTNMGGAIISCTTESLKMRNPIVIAIVEALDDRGNNVMLISRDEVMSSQQITYSTELRIP